MDLFNLAGKKAIVTGAARGLGRAMAEGLAEAGAELVIIDFAEEAFNTAKEISSKGSKASAVKADLSDRESLPFVFEAALETLGGRCDILINNAGINKRSACEEFPIEYWDQVLEINLTSVFLLSQLAGRKMIQQGHGKIINVASLLSFFGGFTVPAYAASKGGVAQLTKALANEWAGKGVNVNAIAPGYMDTNLNTEIKSDPARYEEILRRIPAGRWGSPEDLKGVVIFLASNASNYINGAIIPIDGGYLAR